MNGELKLTHWKGAKSKNFRHFRLSPFLFPFKFMFRSGCNYFFSFRFNVHRWSDATHNAVVVAIDKQHIPSSSYMGTDSFGIRAGRMSWRLSRKPPNPPVIVIRDRNNVSNATDMAKSTVLTSSS
ncbi:hypothetical protein ANCCAN_10414 [Ancylostoma caninum]|uniref:Uncharacterized protein n=1 Tax=Ancylostoma caninum TaxID=29170 RepID=A0A368GGY3_ANCCA|nr:hypothetical protein ANCCAN_10414 [Ancylostoma caninum]